MCGEGDDSAPTIEEAQRLKPDVVVLNVSMPILNGMHAGRGIKTQLAETAIVILSSNADKHFVEEAKQLVPELTSPRPKQTGLWSQPWKDLSSTESLFGAAKQL